MSLGLWALYQRRAFRYTAIEIVQLVFGLSIPLLLASHFGIVRLGGVMFDRPPPYYAAPLLAYWVARPYMVGVQFVLLTVVWIHACIGLYFWLRLKPFFRWAAPFLLAIAVLLPVLAMTGTHRGAHEVTGLAANPQWRSQNIEPTPPPQRAAIEDITLYYFPIFYGVRSCWCSLRAAFGCARTPSRHEHGDLSRAQGALPAGLSMLETSIRYNVPHASVCGGRRAARPAASAWSATASPAAALGTRIVRAQARRC